MNWPCRTVAAACIVLGVSLPSDAGQVKLEIRDGLVTLDAKDATIREIFAEWARVGQTRIVNAERVPGAPMTIQLNGVPERQALETLLRSVAGFVAAPRSVPQVSASQFDRIMLMPATRPAAVATSASPAPAPQLPAFGRRVPEPAVVDDQDEPLPTASMPLPGAPQGAAQPGMPTPMPPQQQAPYGGAGMGQGQQPQSPNQQANPPAQSPSPYNNPYGTPYGNPYNPNPTAPQNPGTQAVPPSPNSAARPGMPTAQIKTPQTGEIR